MRKISVLGSTGSIGKNSLDVIVKNQDKFDVVGLAEGHDVHGMAEQIEKFKPSIVSVRNEDAASELEGLLGNYKPKIVFGIDGACEVAKFDDADMVVSAIVGAAGLRPTMSAIKEGKTIALANKETMVVAGALVTKEASKYGAKIIPVDSEHSAIFQSMEGHRREDVSRIVLTASGGPFLRKSLDEIENAVPEDALKHPKWSMGAKITIDSATLMNKGLEVIEARWLFDMPLQKIGIVVHPQSIVHSMVEYRDGCVVAELGEPDMRAPIAYALSYPERTESGVERLDLAKVGMLTFEEPDFDRFTCLRLALDALKIGGSMPAVLNAANEIAVGAFLNGKIKMGGIAKIVDKTMKAHAVVEPKDMDEILRIDFDARKAASSFLEME